MLAVVEEAGNSGTGGDGVELCRSGGLVDIGGGEEGAFGHGGRTVWCFGGSED